MVDPAESPPVVAWGSDERALLRRARKHQGHNQTQCHRKLLELGATNCAQQAVSAWETGKTGRPTDDNIEAIQKYIAASGLKISKLGATGTMIHRKTFRVVDPNESGETSGHSGDGKFPSAPNELDAAITHRIHNGPALSRWDMEAIRDLRSRE